MIDYSHLEVKVSNHFHRIAVPVLISQVMLRRYNAGQVDVAFFYKSKVFLVEVKNAKYPAYRQIKRLRESQSLLSRIFNCETILLSYNEKKNCIRVI